MNTESKSKSSSKVPKSNTLLSNHKKVGENNLESRHRKGVAFEKQFLKEKLKPKMLSEKESNNSNIMQKEIVLGQKVKIWNDLVEKGRGATYVGLKIEDGPAPNEKGSGRKMEIVKPDQAEQKQAEKIKVLRGANSQSRKGQK